MKIYYLEHNDKKIINWKILTDEEVAEKNLNKKLADLLNLGITIDSNTTIDL